MSLSRPFCNTILFFIIVVAYCTDPGHAAVPPGANGWTYTTLAYRREITLPADPSSSRTNVPIWVDLKPLGNVDLATLKVMEITGSTPVAVAAAAYAQPTRGREPRAFWLAGGTTAAGAARRFLMYYNRLGSPASYTFNPSRSGATFGKYSLVNEGASKHHYTLTGDKAEFKRTARELNGVGDEQHAVFYEQGNGFVYFKDLALGFTPLSGIRMYYAFCHAKSTEAVYFNSDGQEKYFDKIRWDRNGPTLAMSAHYTLAAPLAHQTDVTHRLFQGQPLLEYTLTATPDSGPWLDFDNAIFHVRRFIWDEDNFNPTRMITDLGYDGSLSSNDDSKHYIILANSSGNAIGMFTPKPGVKRRTGEQLEELDGTSSDKASVVIYFGTGKTADLKRLFDTMKRGYPVGAEQLQKFDVMKPVEGQHFITGESISVTAAGPSLGSDAILKVVYPGGTSAIYKPASIGGGSATFNLGAVATTAKFGTWTMTVSSGGVNRIRKIDVLNPDHPRLLFTQSELAALQARWKTDSRYTTYIKSRLITDADAAMRATPPPAIPNKSPRNWGRDTMDLAGALLMEPTRKDYRARMWSNFRTMMAWKEWDPITTGVKYFSNDDVERGEVLQELATVYDWFYSDLSVADRRKYADLFARYADALLACNYAVHYYPRWSTYNSISHNRIMGQCAGLAALDRVIAREVQDERHTPWKTRLDLNYANLMTTLSPDGAFHEGQSYHTLTLWPLFIWSETRRLNTGDMTLYNSAWFRSMPDYVMYGLLPGRVGNFGGLMPFGNSEPRPYFSLRGEMAFPAMRGNNTVAAWLSKNLAYDRVEPIQAFWQDISKPEVNLAGLPNWRWFYKKGIFVFRSNWTNSAMYFAAKCGEYWGGHEHTDSGTFVIHRNGFPYIAAPHYLGKAGTEDENILMANGRIPRGRTDGSYSDAVETQYWGRTLRNLGSPEYFNLLQDPRPAYEDGSNLTFYNREFVGFRDLIVLRDTIRASASTQFRLMFHGYQTDPQTVASEPYDADQYPNTQVFATTTQANRLRLYPNRTKTPGEYMTIYDVSRNGWSTGIGPWRLATKYIPETLSPGAGRRSNSSDTIYTRGGQLTRTLTGSAASALNVFSFRGDTYNVRAWSSAVSDDGVVVYSGTTSNARLKVVWPKGGAMSNVSGAEGLTVTGTMAMRNYDTKEFGGRDLRYLRDDSAQGERSILLSSNVPLTFVSRTAGGVGEAWIICDKAATVTLYYPKTITAATFNGKAVTWSGSGSLKTFNLPANPWGGKLVLMQPVSAAGQGGTGNAASDWTKYQ